MPAVGAQVTNFTVPSSLGGLSKATVLLAMIGNGLMVPRALLTRDKVWLAGSAWACFTGWFQLFSLFQNRDTAGCVLALLAIFSSPSIWRWYARGDKYAHKNDCAALHFGRQLGMGLSASYIAGMALLEHTAGSQNEVSE